MFLVILMNNSQKKLTEPYSLIQEAWGDLGTEIPQAAYATITASPFSVELLRVNYDVEAAADALRRKGAPESYSQMLLRGLSLEDIIAEDKTRENDMEKKCALMARSTREIARKYWPDMKHSEQVRKLSLELFDCLARSAQARQEGTLLA